MEGKSLLLTGPLQADRAGRLFLQSNQSRPAVPCAALMASWSSLPTTSFTLWIALEITFCFPREQFSICCFFFFYQLLNPKSVVKAIWVRAHSYTTASFPNRSNWGRLTWETYWDKKRTPLLNVETLLKAE